jgi:hypothetical protein
MKKNSGFTIFLFGYAFRTILDLVSLSLTVRLFCASVLFSTSFMLFTYFEDQEVIKK